MLANDKGSGETVRMHRLVVTLAVCICYKMNSLDPARICVKCDCAIWLCTFITSLKTIMVNHQNSAKRIFLISS